MDVQHAADLYAQGGPCARSVPSWAIPWTAVGHQLRAAGVTMRPGAPRLILPPHNRSGSSVTEGLTWN